MPEINRKTVSSNFLWRLFEGIGARSVSLIVSIVIARILEPSVYGIVAIVTIFISITQVFVDGGFGSALIQKKDADDLDFSSVFYFNLVFCLFLYALLFFVAPLISDFYNMPELTAVLRVQSITVLISGVKNIQHAYVSKNLLYKKFFFATLAGTIGAAIVGIWMALNGFGVWALVVQGLFNLTVDTIFLWVTVKWRPKLMFSFKRLKVLFSYGWKILISKTIDTIYEDIRSLVIGKKYSTEDLAYYNKAKQFPAIGVTTINTAVESVLFSSMSSEQDDLKKIRKMASISVRVSSYVIFPVMIGLAACSPALIDLLLTSKWNDCVPYMQIFCIGYAFIPITLANLNAIKAIGRSDIYLRLEIVRKVISTITLVSLMWFGPKAIAYSFLINCVINVFINAFPNKKLLNYGYFSQLKDIIPALLLSLAMGLSVYLLGFGNDPSWIILLKQVIVGVAFYIGGSLVFRIESFNYVFDIAKNLFKKSK